MRTTCTALLLACLLAMPAIVLADETPADTKALAKPSQAWQEMNAEVRKAPRPQQRDKMKALAGAYAEAFSKQGGMALGNEALSLGFIQRAAEQWDAAAGSFRSVWANAENPAGLRDQGAMHESRLLGSSDARGAIGGEACLKTLESLEQYAGDIQDESRMSMRSQIESNLASALESMDKKDAAHDMRIAIVKRDPLMASRLYRSLVHGLLGSTHSLDGYAKAQAASKGMLELLAAQQAKAIEILEAKEKEALANLAEKSPDSLDENGTMKPKSPREMSVLERVAFNAGRQLGSAKSYLTRIQDAGKPFAMLGQPAPEWTLEHAFGDVKSIADLKGKVVVLDFWATWCPWCIRSFPAIRDLLKDYADKGLVVVGVTASSSSVYDARYDLDDDLKDKAPAGRVMPAARMARGAQQPDGKTIFSAEEYPAKEKEVIKTFIGNHQMTWPVVMIDKAEPAPKYALGGWPHAVILDRQGRVRYFKSGALLRDRVDAVKKFRAMLEDLLAEKAK